MYIPESEINKNNKQKILNSKFQKISTNSELPKIQNYTHTVS